MLKKLASCFREYTLTAILSPLMVIFDTYLEVMIPLKMADLIDKGVELGDMAFIKSQGMLLILYALGSMSLGIISGITASYASSGFAKNLRHDMYYNVQRFSFSNIDKFSSAGLVTRMTTDITQVQQASMMLMRMAFRAPFTMLFAFIAAFQINNRLPFVFLAAVPFMVIAIGLLMKFGMPLFKKMFGIYDKLNAVVQENVRGIRVVKAFVREKEEDRKFNNVAGELYNTSVRAERLMAFASPIMQFAMYSVTLLICWFGAKLVVSSTMSTGDLMSMFTYISRILTSFLMLSMLILQMTMAAAAGKRIVEVLDEEPDITNCEHPVMEVKDGSIRFEHVNFAYAKSKDCLKDLNFEIKSGETVGIIGGTGSGKSSLAQLIPRLYDVTAGSVSVGGVNVKDIDMETLRKNVSMVLQKNVLFDGSLEDNIRWGKADATEEEIRRALDIAQASEFVDKMEGGLKAHIEQGGANVSGGQRQRLCIARALIAEPKIIIFDDSTSAVDTATEAAIRKGLAEYMPATTKLIIAQRISSVKEADKIIVIDDGVISGIGTHDELLASNRIYQEVSQSQNKGGDFDEQ